MDKWVASLSKLLVLIRANKFRGTSSFLMPASDDDQGSVGASMQGCTQFVACLFEFGYRGFPRKFLAEETVGLPSETLVGSLGRPINAHGHFSPRRDAGLVIEQVSFARAKFDLPTAGGPLKAGA